MKPSPRGEGRAMGIRGTSPTTFRTDTFPRPGGYYYRFRMRSSATPRRAVLTSGADHAIMVVGCDTDHERSFTTSSGIRTDQDDARRLCDVRAGEARRRGVGAEHGRGGGAAGAAGDLGGPAAA